MKQSFRLLFFVTLIFLVECTITKRKYTGGYYVSWHHKPPDTKVMEQTRTTAPIVNKNIPLKNSVNTAAPSKTENNLPKATINVVKKPRINYLTQRKSYENSSTVIATNVINKDYVPLNEMSISNGVKSYNNHNNVQRRTNASIYGNISLICLLACIVFLILSIVFVLDGIVSWGYFDWGIAMGISSSVAGISAIIFFVIWIIAVSS